MRRRSRRRRGAAMVEAVVAIPFFIIIFASMLYVGKLYGQKERTLREAKQQAWTYALNNCEGSSGNASTQSGSNPMGGLNSQGVSLPNIGGNPIASSGGGNLVRSSGTATATVKATVVADKLIGGMTNKLSTTTRMQCNEKPAQGSIGDVLTSAWHAFTQW